MGEKEEGEFEGVIPEIDGVKVLAYVHPEEFHEREISFNNLLNKLNNFP